MSLPVVRAEADTQAPSGQRTQVLGPDDRVRLIASLAHRLGGRDLQDRTPIRPLLEMHEQMIAAVDPSVAALLENISGVVQLGKPGQVNFTLLSDGCAHVPAGARPHARSFAFLCRWGFELVRLMEPVTRQLHGYSPVAALLAGLAHGSFLFRLLPTADRVAAAGFLPESLVRYLGQHVDLAAPPAERRAACQAMAELAGDAELAAALQASMHESAFAQAVEQLIDATDLALPVEHLLTSGGDSRLRVDPRNGLNRYGTAPRPRPEAIPFSSSTASSISDHAFLLCDQVRAALLCRVLTGSGTAFAERRRLGDHIRAELLAWLGMSGDDADVILAASGTDTELLTVLLALGAGPEPVTNIVVAPEETGRGVVMAAAGRYFDDLSPTGSPVHKNQPAWPDRQIEVQIAAIRDDNGEPRAKTDVAADLERLTRDALARGHHVIIHLLLASKTGLSAPDMAAVERIAQLGRVDVVVDACQLRISRQLLAALVRRGWMVQISGSKFLTGPAFSGALLVPRTMRVRRERVAEALAQAPAVSRRDDWPAGWRIAFDAVPDGRPVFGPLFRWAAALAEASLMAALDVADCRRDFEAFRSALQARLARSESLLPLSPVTDGAEMLDDEPPGLAARSIICFAVLGPERDGQRRPLELPECQALFELLNLDVADRVPSFDAAERSLAAQPAHIGQPVELRPGVPGVPAVLRLVVGVRFFTNCGYAGADAAVARAGEIRDAILAVDKLKLLARHWASLRVDPSG